MSLVRTGAKAKAQPDLWGGEFATAHERFPGKTGRVLRNHMDSIYVVFVAPQVALFRGGLGGSRVFVRRDCNKLRYMRGSVEGYKPRMFREGIHKGSRMTTRPRARIQSCWFGCIV